MLSLSSVIAASTVLAQVDATAFLDRLQAWLPWLITLAKVGGALLVIAWLTLCSIPNDKVGVVEKLWSFRGSVPEGRVIALNGEAGYQASLLRGGLHFGYWKWQYRIHRLPLVTVSQGKLGYVYARDGESLPPSQTLARMIACENFQDATAFLREPTNAATKRGQRGRQRAILREGVYAINPACFVIITEEQVYSLGASLSAMEQKQLGSWQRELKAQRGFDPVVVGSLVLTRGTEDPAQGSVWQKLLRLRPELPKSEGSGSAAGEQDIALDVDNIGIVTIHDGPSLPPGEIIAPPVGTEPGDPHYHNNFQDPDAFLLAGGLRGRQYLPLTDGTYFINRWFASIEYIEKTVVPIGHVGVVVSYYGRAGRDLSGDAFRHGERVSDGERGVWQRPLGPGKYAFNTYAGTISLVPTTNFVLHWITGRSESHRYDESLRSIDLVTRDAYEPTLPLSVVVHIDYQKAPSVIQRFGDVHKLITQTLDPLLSAYFRDVAHRKTMLELLHERDKIQAEARDELCRRFQEFDIQCVDVLIGKPDTAAGGKIETLLEQLRLRQLSIEQIETYERQRAAAEKLQVLNEAQAQAAKQTDLTNARMQVQIIENQAAAELARARKQAEQTVVSADAELARSKRLAEQTVLLAEAESQQRTLAGRGEGQRIMLEGLSEAAVMLRKIAAVGDPRLFALSQVTANLSQSQQPLVPERLFVAAGSDGANQSLGLVQSLISLLLAEQSGLDLKDASPEVSHALREMSDNLTKQVLSTMQHTMPQVAPTEGGAPSTNQT